jgi:hypothetical protein
MANSLSSLTSHDSVYDVRILKTDTPSGVRSGLSGAGGDETANPQWSPNLLF